ncbi:glycine betaine ABC transporter substrate-binding protein [Nitratidesulfovibrio vulgaris]|uniref:Glycine/betaine/L-proline ABC transporter, periplasmic-binding protein n=1 Tax=Nitratidesulfovibrio vulgaris (strain ATCC 29579 / DSM 644 / CCUG 34227 / NCIMB 8303 / VKM B-1760 / Hildenborough) TaxID=882 RepID=Q729Q3_NITV2|nr:glycine betaine ABC transporter substrate-binding protein [Nitratidesulfovibrio vulgaris]AAS96770.1 glycine/betaine/L-proline ABC transporter, periplasmic-binding protein [Nitratidesulfovibrio vulgaris str. Hildenborough]ADP87275.1 Substrate-binding region of ABC-type glycine betaine transport system [Nitratidesulfovibrio vulgaris RCH1]
MKKIILLAVAFLLAFTGAAQAASKDAKPVRIAYVEWDCARATSNLVKAAIEDRLHRKVELLPVSAGAMWMAVASGDVDATVTAWLPVTHGDYLKRLEGKVRDLGPLVDGARLGWAVPDYVTVNSIAELDAAADRFGGRIIGIDPGAGLMRMSEDAIKAYGLKKMQLVEGSGATMTAALADAIRRKEWIVVTAWSPHWMFGRWQLKYLDDPKGALGGMESIHTVVRKGLDKDMPEVFAFLDRFAYADTAQLQTLMAWNNEEGADPLTNARRFMKEHPALVDSWLAK